jgi:hypothetical protein
MVRNVFSSTKASVALILIAVLLTHWALKRLAGQTRTLRTTHRNRHANSMTHRNVHVHLRDARLQTQTSPPWRGEGADFVRLLNEQPRIASAIPLRLVYRGATALPIIPIQPPVAGPRSVCELAKQERGDRSPAPRREATSSAYYVLL